MVDTGSMSSLNKEALDKHKKNIAIDIFRQADMDGSGALNQDEVYMALKKFFSTVDNPKRLNRKFSDDMFKKYDKNKTKNISLKEFISLTNELFMLV